jgi:hypothetical protein
MSRWYRPFSSHYRRPQGLVRTRAAAVITTDARGKTFALVEGDPPQFPSLRPPAIHFRSWKKQCHA